jgi:O-antigen ligase
VSLHRQTIDLRRADAKSWRRAALLVTAFLFPAGYATLGAVALLAVLLVIAFRRPGALWQRTPLDLPLGLLVLVLSLSAVFSPYPVTAAGATMLLALLIVLAFGSTAATLVHTPGALFPVLWALAAGTAVAAVWGTITYLMAGQPAHTAALGYNALGTTLATGLPILLGLGVKAEGPARFAAAGAAAITLVGLALTFARGAWLGGAAGVLLFVVLLPRQALRSVTRVLASVLLVSVLALADSAGTLVQRAQSVSAPGAMSDRVAMWRASVAMLRDRPLLGNGLNTFGLMFPRYQPREERISGQPFAHNIFLTLGAEGGLLGLAAFLAVLSIAAVMGLSWLRGGDTAERIQAAGVLAAAGALMVHQQVDGTVISFHIGFGLWLLLGIMTARGAAEPPGGRERAIPYRGWRKGRPHSTVGGPAPPRASPGSAPTPRLDARKPRPPS